MKKLMILVALLALNLIWPFRPSVQAKTIVYGGMQVPIPGGDTHGIGAGTIFAVGQEVSEKMTVWLNVNDVKTKEGTEINSGSVGFSLFTDKFFGFGGLYLNLEGGIGKVEGSGEGVEFASLVGGGAFFDVSKNTKIWVGAGQSNTGDVAIYSIQAGLSMGVDWR